jgi:hypothetical protein
MPDDSDRPNAVRQVRSASTLLQMLLQDRHAATVADTLQAERWQEWLLHERSELSCELMTRRNHLEQCAASVETDALSHVHGALRVLENDIRAIDRMLDSLARRFPDAVPTLQQA